ncbi:MAG: phosphoglycolate phosphatase [Salinarimonadaceae bacterium]|nr:MAG: phosphoglycolate phosphatase [Salinarimonadaceae bacterium]
MKPIIVFDLDGTLADTAPDLMATLNMLLAREGLATLPVERAGSMIGAGAKALIARGFESAGRELSSERHEALFQDFIAHYGENICVGTRLFPGVTEALDVLEAAGFDFAVCTNKMERQSKMLLEALGLAPRFSAICGRDTFAFHKPDPRHLTQTIDMAGGDRARAVMVGDSLTDIATAQAARVPVVAVPFGYSDRPVAELGPDLVIDHFDDLPLAIHELLRVRVA